MNGFTSYFISFRRWAGIFGGLALLSVFFGGLYFFPVSAETEPPAPAAAAEQNFVLGKLLYLGSHSTISFGYYSIGFVNANGSDAGGVDQSPSLGPGSWSGDGTKVLYPYGGRDLQVYDVNTGARTTIPNTMNASFPTWSVTGKIAYLNSGQLWVMNADGSGQTPFPGITMSVSYPIWSPDGSKLAFVSGGDIWTINADGTNVQRVTTGSTSDADPAWSSDGSKLVFRRGSTGIAVINLDGTNETNLTNNSADQEPSWSSDGSRIAFSRNTGGVDGGIFVMDPDGANQFRIIANSQTTPSIGSRFYRPRWQPVVQAPNTFTISGRVTNGGAGLSGVTVNLDGTTRAAATTDAAGYYQFSNLSGGGSYTVSPSFARYYFAPANRSYNNLAANQTANFDVAGVCQSGKCVKNGSKIAFSQNGDIFTINTDGTQPTNITNNASAEARPGWSPDGLNIIFGTNRDGNGEIYRMNPDGTNPARLTNNAASDAWAVYSPDGATIAFTSERDGNSEIYKMNADGSNQVRLTNEAANDREPAFSPDGSKILFISRRLNNNDTLWTINADGSNPQALSSVQGYYNRPSYSPDGSKIIVEYGIDGTQAAMWTMNADGTARTPLSNPGGARSPAYSPDGAKLTYVCCFLDIFNNPPRVRTMNAGGGGEQILPTPSSSSNWSDAPVWQPLKAPRPTLFDFDGDGRSDVSAFRSSNSAWYILRSTEGLWVPVWGLSTDVLAPADYDGDLKTDVAVWRPSSGDYYVLNSFDSTVRIENFGLLGDIPTGGDWDADGKADVAVYRGGTQGVLYYRGSMGNPNRNISFIPWGVPGDKPLSGDWDGDGRADAAVFRPSNGGWYVRKSSDGQMLSTAFGLATDKPVPADYDGDGKTDFAVFRDGTWYLLRSAQGFTAFQFGIAKDIPAPADFDGDGRADATIFRNGVWWILKSQSGTAEAVSFGAGGDAPVPSTYVR